MVEKLIVPKILKARNHLAHQPTAIVARFSSADSRVLRILNMFDRGSWSTITESVAEFWPILPLILPQSGQNWCVGMELESIIKESMCFFINILLT